MALAMAETVVYRMLVGNSAMLTQFEGCATGAQSRWVSLVLGKGGWPEKSSKEHVFGFNCDGAIHSTHAEISSKKERERERDRQRQRDTHTHTCAPTQSVCLSLSLSLSGAIYM